MAAIKITANFTVYKDHTELSEQDQKLFTKAVEARKKAYAPYSNFSVGVALLLENDSIILGNNQENAAYPSGMCAERVAIWNASSQYPELKVSKIFISASSSHKMVDQPVSPCGSCRQTMVEYEINQAKNIAIYFTGETGTIIKSDSVKDLLPLTFDSSLL
ncbi:MAG: cytidine deaminase [Flavobacteriaceae bacterium]|nr:cytidine deaminase [Flavobacteriaceae bacterium]